MREAHGGKVEGLANDAPEPGMGVDRASIAFGDKDVLLPGAGFYHEDVAGLDGAPGIDQPRAIGAGKPSVRVGVAQPIAFGRDGLATRRGKARKQQADAVEAACRIASLEPERHAHERCGGACEAPAVAGHVPP